MACAEARSGRTLSQDCPHPALSRERERGKTAMASRVWARQLATAQMQERASDGTPSAPPDGRSSRASPPASSRNASACRPAHRRAGCPARLCVASTSPRNFAAARKIKRLGEPRPRIQRRGRAVDELVDRSTTGSDRTRCRCRTDPARGRTSRRRTGRPAIRRRSPSRRSCDSALAPRGISSSRMNLRNAAEPPTRGAIFLSSAFSVGPVMSRRRSVFSMPTSRNGRIVPLPTETCTSPATCRKSSAMPPSGM